MYTESGSSPSGSSRAEAAIGKSLLASPTAVIHEDAASEVMFRSAVLSAESWHDFVWLRLLNIAWGFASNLNLLQRCLSALFPAQLRSVLWKVEWMCFPPDTLCWAGAAPYDWWRWLFNVKKTEKRNPNIFLIAILTSWKVREKKKKLFSGSVQMFRGDLMGSKSEMIFRTL